MDSDAFLDQLLSLPSVAHALLSPDGRWVAFAWYRIHENYDVFAVPTDGSAPPLALTHTPDYTWLVSWAPDSRSVIVEQDRDGDEHVRLFRVDLQKPGVMQLLTEDRPPYFIHGGSLHPDGVRLFYGANYDFSAGQVIDPTWIYSHDLRTGERHILARPERPCFMEVRLNRQGTHLLYSRQDRHPSGRQFWLVDVQGRNDQEILNFGDRCKVFARWFPDGEHILVLSESTGGRLHESPQGRPQDHQSLGIYHWPTGELRWLIDDPQRSIEGTWVSPEGTVVVDEMLNAGHVATYIELPSRAERPFPRLPGNLLPLGKSADGGWVGMYYTATTPTELVRFGEGARSVEDLSSLTRGWEHTALRPEQLCRAEAFSWYSVDGQQVWGWLYRARPNPERAIVFVHGGPTWHSEDCFNAQIQYLVSRGFNVLDVNYRGSTGYGLKFREMIKEDGWGGREQCDIASGARALIAAGLARPGRVGVTGTSYGGYSSWFQITFYPQQVIAAAAPICGMTDLVVDYETTRPDLRPLSEEMIGGNPQQVPDRYYARSPIHFVHYIRGKLFIIQGAQDPNVTPENVRQVRQRLDQHGIPFELLVFEDEGHGIAKTVNQRVLYARLAEFFEDAL
jgi:dipeptidyl aminopeptidase/acylaminoacyl peptidase